MAGVSIFLVAAVQHADPGVLGAVIGGVPVVPAIAAPLITRLGPADLAAVDTLISAGFAASRAQVLRWALGRIRKHPAYAQLQQRCRRLTTQSPVLTALHQRGHGQQIQRATPDHGGAPVPVRLAGRIPTTAGRSMADGAAAVAALLPGARVEPVERLRKTERSEVWRVRASGPGWPGPGTLIVKLFAGAGEAWVRESSALAAVPAGAPVPGLVAAGVDPPVVVMADAGRGPSVADALLAGDAATARAAVGRFAEALARLHLSTQGARAAFGAQLAARSGGTVAESAMPGLAGGAAAALASLAGQLGVAVPGGALAALAGLPGQLSAAGPAALTLADACPDNNVLAGEGYLLIDFEEAEWRHIAWDVAYLTVPWPSCWCSFRLPAAVTRQALARYRAVITARLAYAGTPAFERDLALAATGWALISASWFLPKALADDPPLHDAAAGLPTRRAVILHRLGSAHDSPADRVLAEFAGRLRAALARRWGEVPLQLAPAFRSGSAGPGQASPPGSAP